MGLQSRWVEVDGVRLHTRVGGNGPPVVLVHGFGVSGSYMVPLARELVSSFSVYAVDLPGHGQSSRPRGHPSISSLAEALEGWLDIVGLMCPALVAHSMGCQVVTQLAVRAPARVGPLVLIGPTVDPRGRSARHQLMCAVRDLRHEPISLLARSALEDVDLEVSTLLSTFRSALADPIEDRLPFVAQPTTIVHGGDDGFVSRRWVEDVVRLLPSGRLVVIPGEPHAVQYTRPKHVAHIVRHAVVDSRNGSAAATD